MSCADDRRGWNGGGWIRKERRLAIYLRDGMRCGYCYRDLHDAPPAEITLDHFIPRCKGGSNDATNLFTACKYDNSARGAKSVKAYAGAGAYLIIQRNRRRKLGKYLELARALIKGEAGENEPRNFR